MKKILVILFSLICVVAYPQRRNEYGQKMVKSITIHEYLGAYKGMAYRYVLEYDDMNKSTSSKLFIKQDNSDSFDLFETYTLGNGVLIHKKMNWDTGKLVESLDKEVQNKYILNDKGHLIQEIQLFPGEKEVWNYYYDKDISIYDENLVKVEYIETDRNGNYFIGPMGNVVEPFIVKEGDYSEPSKKNFEFKPLNDTNITLYNIIILGKDDLLYLTTWVPYYYPWVPVKKYNYDGKESVKYEYYNDENDNLNKIIVYWLNNGVYKLKRKIEIEYLY